MAGICFFVAKKNTIYNPQCYEMSTNGIERSAKLKMVFENTFVSMSLARNLVRRSS